MKKIEICMPKMGESVEEATLIQWLKKEGDSISKDEDFVVIGTDKVESEIPSEINGKIIQLLFQEGEILKVGDPICILETMDEIPTHLQAKKKKENTVSNSKTSELDKPLLADKYLENNSFLSPLVRKIAIQENLSLQELQKIKPSGANNRLTKKDVLDHLYPNKKQGSENIKVSYELKKRKLNILEKDEVLNLSSMRKLIAEHMLTSIREIPHVTSFVEVDVSDLVAWREKNKESFLKNKGVKLTYTPIFFQLISDSLKEYPSLNAWMNVDELIIKKEINLGFAAALPDGNLIVPNLKNAGNLSLVEMAKSLNELGSNAKNNKLKPSDIQDTTFTVSNTGIFGSVMGTPIISVPQVAILALGKIEEKATVIKGEIKIRKKMMLSMSYDHRVIDGALASKFLSLVKGKIEHYK